MMVRGFLETFQNAFSGIGLVAKIRSERMSYEMLRVVLWIVVLW